MLYTTVEYLLLYRVAHRLWIAMCMQYCCELLDFGQRLHDVIDSFYIVFSKKCSPLLLYYLDSSCVQCTSCMTFVLITIM